MIPFSTAPRTAILAEGEVHVYRARLDPEEDTLQKFEATLDAGEADRASRFRFPQLRTRFIASHGMLRLLLGAYLEIEPKEVGFTNTRHGKPELIQGPGRHLKFNMAHSENLALFAFAREFELGVDVEFKKTDFPAIELAREIFTQREQELLTPPEVTSEYFFRIWTCKEALLKAAGKGLSVAPRDLEVFFTEPPTIEAHGGPLAGSHWSLFELDAGAGYAGALVVSEKPAAVRCYERLATES